MDAEGAITKKVDTIQSEIARQSILSRKIVRQRLATGVVVRPLVKKSSSGIIHAPQSFFLCSFCRSPVVGQARAHARWSIIAKIFPVILKKGVKKTTKNTRIFIPTGKFFRFILVGSGFFKNSRRSDPDNPPDIHIGCIALVQGDMLFYLPIQNKKIYSFS